MPSVQHNSKSNGSKDTVRSAAYFGKEIAAMNRAASIATVDPEKMLATLLRLMQAPASTPSDVLALVVTARTLMAIPIEEAARLDESLDDLALYCISGLLDRIVGAMEVMSGEKDTTFRGGAPALN